MKGVGNKRRNALKLCFWEKVIKRCKKIFDQKNKIKNLKKIWGQKKKSGCRKKNFFSKFFCFKNTKIDLVKRKINIFSKFLEENNPETMPDSPVECIRNMIFNLIVNLFPTFPSLILQRLGCNVIIILKKRFTEYRTPIYR